MRKTPIPVPIVHRNIFFRLLVVLEEQTNTQIMVVNPYRQSDSLLPTSFGDASPQHGFLFKCFNILTCGLLSRKISYYYFSLRVLIIILIIALALVSYYFHTRFTHATLLSNDFLKRPKHPEAAFHLHTNLTAPNRFRGQGNDIKTAQWLPASLTLARPKQKEEEKEEDALGEEAKEPLNINDHFHRHRDIGSIHPIHLHLHKDKKEEETKTEEKEAHKVIPDEIPVIMSPSPTLLPSSLPVQQTTAETKKEEIHSTETHPVKSEEKISLLTKPAKIAVNRTSSIEPSKLKEIGAALHSITKMMNPNLKSSPNEQQQLPISSSSTNNTSSSGNATTSDSEQRHSQHVNSLKEKLMARLKQQQNKQQPHNLHSSPPSSSSLTTDHQEETDKSKAETTTTTTTPLPPVNHNAVILPHETDTHHENENKVTAYDLPKEVVTRVKNNTLSTLAKEPDSAVKKVKIDYCKGQVDPFEKIPVDRFTPPKDAPFEAVTAWKKKMNEFLTSVSKLKIGGDLLREKLTNDVTDLKVLRFKLFCQYA
jgi:hypothetical protein